jgi:hypothetical protein
MRRGETFDRGASYVVKVFATVIHFLKDGFRHLRGQATVKVCKS